VLFLPQIYQKKAFLYLICKINPQYTRKATILLKPRCVTQTPLGWSPHFPRRDVGFSGFNLTGMGNKVEFFKTSSKYHISALALLIAIGGSSTAVAQTSQDTEIIDSDVITVTARKRDETLVEVPISIDAFSQDDLNKLGITSAEALSQATPSFDFQNVGTGGASGRANPQIRFRGVGLQISDPNAPVAGTFWDGVSG